MFSRFFIDRPIFAGVLSILITLAGGLAVYNLPLAQYPPVTPPTVMVQCSYPGASAQVVAKTVAAPIEQQVNGVEKMLYMSSQCTNDGAYNLTVTFQQGVNLNLAQVLVQNRVNLALPMLPDVLKKSGVTTRKLAPDILMSVNIQSPKGRYDQLYLSNYAFLHLRDELLRVDGVGDMFISGQRDYSMRIWVDPEKLASRSLTADDVVAAIREQNQQVACGQIGQQPVPPGQQTQITLATLGRLQNPEQFGNIILRASPGGRITRLRDVARVVLGAKSEDISAKIDGHPSVGLIIFQLPDANALDVADRIHAKMDQLAKEFPEDLIYEIQYDTTPYTRQCIREVVKSLRDAVILVACVVLLFLQNWRSAMIPLVAVPVAIIGTFAVMAVMGFSLNNLTLFGLVLAVGIVVDDAIVVVEAVEHHIELGMAPREATIKAMSLVSGPVMAVGLVLSAVFVPCAFITGLTGQFFRQFALTIAASTIFSTFNSLSLSPALSAMLLRPRRPGEHHALPRLLYMLACGWAGYVWLEPQFAAWLGRLAGWAEAAPWAAGLAGAAAGWLAAPPVNYVLGEFFTLFDRGFRRFARGYLWGTGKLLRVVPVTLVLYGGLLLLTYRSFVTTPKGFIPTQDMGYAMLGIQLPDAASAERSVNVTERVLQICRDTPGVKHTVAQAGNSFLLGASASNFASMFVILADFAEREGPGLSAYEIVQSLNRRCLKEVPEALISVFPAPPIRGVSRTGGLKLMVEDRGDAGLSALQEQGDKLRAACNREINPKRPGEPMLDIRPNVFRANMPQLYVDMDRAECMFMHVPLAEAFDTLQVYLGSLYVNDFNLFGRTWQVIVQADARFRDRVAPVKLLKTRNSDGGMVPMGALADIREINGPLIITRYNMYAASAIQGTQKPGVSSRQAIDLVQQVADRELPPSMRYEWTDLAFLELQAGDTAMYIFAAAVVMVFLVLAAQYESWSLPLAVILVVPMCLLSAVTGVSAVPLGFQSLAAGAKGLAAGAGHISPVAQGWFAGAGQYLISTAGGTTAQIEINIFTQIGFVVLVGLASKNAILIVEFAKRQRAEGLSRREAALAACKLRLRPIVMTSMSFVLGVSTLLLAHGAGCEMRRTLGTAVFSGMLGVTLFGLVLTPSFFCLIDWLGSARLFGPRWLGAPAVRLAGEVVLATVVLSFALAPILLPLIDRLLGPRLWYGVARLVESGRFTPASARTTLEISLLMGVLAFAVTVIRLGLWQVRRPPAPRKEQD